MGNFKEGMTIEDCSRHEAWKLVEKVKNPDTQDITFHPEGLHAILREAYLRGSYDTMDWIDGNRKEIFKGMSV